MKRDELEDCVLEIMSRPENSRGMRVAEVFQIIKKEKGISDEGYINNVQGSMYRLKEAGKLERVSAGVYAIKGAAAKIEEYRQQGAGIAEAVKAILAVYDRVASGETQGSGGSYYADGKGTLQAIMIDVGLLENLARAAGAKVYGRTKADREAN